MSSDTDFALYGTSGGDHLIGSDGNDTLDGGAGNDLLEGGTGNDTYVWGPGHGSDVVRDYGGQDKVVINATLEQLKFYTKIGEKGYPLIIQFGDDIEERLYIEGYFNDEPYKNGQIEKIVLADGSEWSLQDILQIVQQVPEEQPAPVKNLYLLGTQHNDTLTGGAGHDTLIGGEGDDVLLGGTGNDIYVWNPNYGHDLIKDTGGLDMLRIGSDSSGFELTLLDDGTLVLSKDGASVTIRNYLDTSANGGHIEKITFMDGTVWNLDKILELLEEQVPPPPPPPPPPKDVIIIGTEHDDTLQGGEGNDTLVGGSGNDTYLWSYTGGDDRIRDTHGIDTLILSGSPSNFVFSADLDNGNLFIKQNGRFLTIEGYFGETGLIEKIVFADGTVWTLREVKIALGIEVSSPPPPLEGRLVLGTADNDTLEGTASHDTLDGGAGDDLMKGGAGNNVYRWAFGSGNDTISDSRGVDTLSIHANSSEVQFAATGADYEDLMISLHGQKLVIDNYFLTAEDGGNIENIAFADGQVWQIGHIWKLLQVRNGSSRDDVIYGKSGKDSLKGNAGHDMLVGGGGNDALNGGAGNDRLVGGTGVDVLTGGTGRDVFVFGKGDTGIRSKRDIILDFKVKEDRIDLTGIDANTGTKADNAFGKLLSAKQKFTAAGQMRYDAKTGLLSLNTDKDAAAEFELLLKNKPAYLKLSDFYL
ncbi:calcium-binding protein [Microvirga solisilvae]|uniref:calcium-binding protein n=1 Tax=Microvirga solisilvae TaxID=2919498 RepID=UPI0024345CE4|nr:calcium-binding protein [Microvirga solisilvae]